MKTIFKIFVTLVMLAGSAAYADGPYYVSNCDSGADPQCHNGSDTNNGLSPNTPFQTFTKIQSLVDTTPSPGGRTIRLAKGAKWTTAVPLGIASCKRCTPAAPLIIEGYTPPQGGAGTRWEFEQTTATATMIKFEDSGTSDSDQGYIIRNGHIHPSSTIASVSNGFYFYNDADDIIIEDMEIDHFGMGVYIAGGNAPTAGDPGNGLVDRLTVRNNNIHDNIDMGVMGACNSCVFENNDFVNNGGGHTADADTVKNHNIYINDATAGFVTGIRIIGNRLSRSAVCTASTPRGAPSTQYPAGPTCADLGRLNRCNSASLVVHARHKNLVIENNVIDETPGARDTCYGIQVDAAYSTESEYFRDTVIRSNKVINVGSNGISVGSCPYCIIESNEVIWTGGGAGDTHLGIVVPDGNVQNGPTQFDDHDTNMLIRNNTVYVGGTSSANVGIVVNTPGSNLGQRVFNNLVYFPTGTVAGVSCYRMDSTISNFAVWDYNMCYSAGAVPNLNQNVHKDMAAWRGAGFDVHGQFGNNPQIDTPSASNGYSVAVSLNSNLSPIRNAGHPSLSKRVGIRGRVNPDTSFVGANPYGLQSVTAPNSPSLN